MLANRKGKARLSVQVRGARLQHTSKACYSLHKYTARRHPKDKRVPSCKPCFVCSECSSSGRPVCNRWPILSALPAAGIVAGLCPPWCFKHGTLIIPKPRAWARGFSGQWSVVSGKWSGASGQGLVASGERLASRSPRRSTP